MSEPASVKYASLVGDWLAELGYTHCFFVAGGNIMHLLDAVRSRFTCVPVVHEVAAGIAVEYFNEVSPDAKAFALVTAGPGVTNITTAMAGAFLESREQLVLAGQVKTEDLARDQVRQRGIQEVDGVSLSGPVSVRAFRLEQPLGREEFFEAITVEGRQGPVFLEFCLDVQAAPIDPSADAFAGGDTPRPAAALISGEEAVAAARNLIAGLMQDAERPIWLIGGGVSREVATALRDDLARLGVPLMSTWNGADRVDSRNPFYFGRPNTWGQRSANLLIQQADLVVAFGSRLGLQQTGFNWQEFVPAGKLVQVDIDRSELEKGHPRVDYPLAVDAGELLEGLVSEGDYPGYGEWVDYCRAVRETVPLVEKNTTGDGYVSPYRLYERLSSLTRSDDILTICSSGGANSVGMQVMEPWGDQLLVADKGLASMGYGLAGAIGAAYGAPGRRVVLVEGDGGFAQQSQELATLAVGDLDVKVVIFDNNGYASIRMTQLNYFGGEYLGCDVESGLGFPDWERLFGAYGIPAVTVDAGNLDGGVLEAALERPGPSAVVVKVDPEQTYFPKISSRVTEDGSMVSNPLHRMSPDLPDDLLVKVGRYLPGE